MAKLCQMSACSATSRKVFFSPPPPISIGMSRVGAGLSLASLDVFEPGSELERVCTEKMGAPRNWERLGQLFGDSDTLAIDRTSLDVLQAEGAVLDQTTRWLRRNTDVRSVEHVRWLRRGRFAAMGLVIALGVGVKLHDALATPNVALGKSVTMSSLSFGSPPVERSLMVSNPVVAPRLRRKQTSS